jgi:hypothetical protein
MYWEFKIRNEKFKPYSKDIIVFRVRTFLAWSKRENGKVKKERTYIGTIKIYGEDTQKTKTEVWRVFSKVAELLKSGNVSSDGIGSFIEKGQTKLDKRINAHLAQWHSNFEKTIEK